MLVRRGSAEEQLMCLFFLSAFGVRVAYDREIPTHLAYVGI